ncbi:MAG: dihydrofolate reductase [Duncaniella sp.]|nr:dihydrofolate reductase [Duncaniella sp.]
MISIIVAATRDFAIGDKGDLLYPISDDLRHFKQLTMGHPIIMGRKTFESFPKGALPGRRNIVVTRDAAYSAPSIEIAHSIEAALEMCRDQNPYIIGGGTIYAEALPLADMLELTLIDVERPDADTRFPAIDLPVMASEAFDRVDPRSGLRYCFMSLPLR